MVGFSLIPEREKLSGNLTRKLLLLILDTPKITMHFSSILLPILALASSALASDCPKGFCDYGQCPLGLPCPVSIFFCVMKIPKHKY